MTVAALPAAQHIAQVAANHTPDVLATALDAFRAVRAGELRAAAEQVEQMALPAGEWASGAVAMLRQRAEAAESERPGERAAMLPEEFLGALNIVHSETLRRNEVLKQTQTNAGMILAGLIDGAAEGSVIAQIWAALHPDDDTAPGTAREGTAFEWLEAPEETLRLREWVADLLVERSLDRATLAEAQAEVARLSAAAVA